MKFKIIILSLFFLCPISIIAQTNSEIANVYIKRAEDSFYDLDIDKSLEIFNKALKYMDSVPNSRVAKLGTLLHYEHKQYFEARSYARWYFELEKDKSSEDYQTMLETFVNVQEEIDKYVIEQKALEAKRLKEELEAKRLDSLNKLWVNLSKAYIIEIDSISKFNKYNLAVFHKDGNIGIMDDIGSVIESPSDYTDFISYDGFILMFNKPSNPTKVYAFNCKSKSGFLLPSILAFNATSTHYGKVMLPRANGLVVAYPDNSNKAYVYNLLEKSFSSIESEKDLLKNLKKNDIIEKYNKDGQVRINKQWLNLGSHIGASVFELYENGKLFGFLNTSNGKVWDVAYYNYLGGFYDDNFELLEGNMRFWLDAEGVRRETNKNENGIYSGVSRFIKNTDGNYIITQNRDGRDYLVLGDKSLINQKHFIAKASK